MIKGCTCHRRDFLLFLLRQEFQKPGQEYLFPDLIRLYGVDPNQNKNIYHYRKYLIDLEFLNSRYCPKHEDLLYSINLDRLYQFFMCDELQNLTFEIMVMQIKKAQGWVSDIEEIAKKIRPKSILSEPA